MIEGFAGVGTHMYLSQRNAKLTLTHLQPRGDVLVVVHDGRALETYELGPSSVPRSPTSSEAAILTYSTFDCSDGAHTMPLRSSLISRRFSSSTFRTHIRRPSACTRPNRSRAIRFGRHETLPRISHSPRASARMKLART